MAQYSTEPQYVPPPLVFDVHDMIIEVPLIAAYKYQYDVLLLGAHVQPIRTLAPSIPTPLTRPFWVPDSPCDITANKTGFPNEIDCDDPALIPLADIDPWIVDNGKLSIDELNCGIDKIASLIYNEQCRFAALGMSTNRSQRL